MFAGKSEELIRRVRRAQYARKSVQVFKPGIDIRADGGAIQTHNGVYHAAVAVNGSAELEALVEAGTDMIVIEEAQFFDSCLVETSQRLADRGYQVVVAGLDMDFRGRPFGPMPALLAVADDVVKLHAICAVCGADASRSQRLIDGRPAPESAPTVLIGAQEHYEARCRSCHERGD